MDFVNRLKFFMENGNIAISQFADTCRIPRPTMSQILNGRNKKVSDELISKIHAAYPELSVLWLMFGEGEMLTKSNTQISEAQNDGESADPTIQSAQPQPIAEQETARLQFTENSTDNFGTSPSLFPYENEEDMHPVAGTESVAADAQQFYVTTHEVIEFDPVNDSSELSTEAAGSRPGHKSINHIDKRNTDANQTENNLSSSKPSEDTYRSDNAKHINNISVKTTSDRRITNIVVFYSDNSFQSFYPTLS